ncbi:MULTISPECIES: diguanylate cyclase [unclassified Blastococcus]
MIGPDLRTSAPVCSGPAAPGGHEHRVAAVTVAVLLAMGGVMGSVNLLVDGVLREGVARWAYAGTMLLLLALAAALAARRRIGPGYTLVLVLLGDLIYLVVVLCIQDPLRYATPLMLLFPALAAAWFLELRALAVHMAVTTGVCLAALWPSYDSAVALGVQVGVSAVTLNVAATAVYLLRRRVQRLLVETATLTHLDPLTGLHNRRYLVEQAERLWGQARRDGTRICAMVLDLDHFKRLNDEFGHAVGDSVLSSVAAALSAAVRPADVLARTGGEELVVVGSVGDPAEARRLAERLRAAVARGQGAGGHVVTASIGLAVTRPGEGDDAVAALWRLVDEADAAMYRAKREGRDRVATAVVPRARSPRAEQASS